jgi:transcriptional regulator with XRE-family HTH domain
MIKASNFREALGLTQEEVAMLLRISMSQLSMFEIGQRDLSSEAMLKLLNMYNYVQNKSHVSVENPILKEDTDKITLLLEKELKENQYEQMVLERKTHDFKRKYQKSISTLKLVEYLETQVANKEKYEKELVGILRKKALSGIEKNGVPIQVQWDLKLKALQFHQKELQKQLKQLP